MIAPCPPSRRRVQRRRTIHWSFDTLGRLRQHGLGLVGYCLIYRKVFAVDLAALIAELGADSPVIGMKPLRCPSCGGVRTKKRVTVPQLIRQGASKHDCRPLDPARGRPGSGKYTREYCCSVTEKMDSC